MEHFPSEKCNFSTQMSCFAHYFDTFELLFRKHLRGVDFVFFEKFPEDRSSGGQHYEKNCSYECRHQSDTVCHNIFDSYTCDSTRHPLNISQKGGWHRPCIRFHTIVGFRPSHHAYNNNHTVVLKMVLSSLCPSHSENVLIPTYILVQYIKERIE